MYSCGICGPPISVKLKAAGQDIPPPHPLCLQTIIIIRSCILEWACFPPIPARVINVLEWATSWFWQEEGGFVFPEATKRASSCHYRILCSVSHPSGPSFHGLRLYLYSWNSVGAEDVGAGNILSRAFRRRIVRYWYPLGCRAIELRKPPQGGVMCDVNRRVR